MKSVCTGRRSGVAVSEAIRSSAASARALLLPFTASGGGHRPGCQDVIPASWQPPRSVFRLVPDQILKKSTAG